MLKNMKVKKSLILGYGITIVISVALIIASLMMMNNQRGQYEMLMNEDVVETFAGDFQNADSLNFFIIVPPYTGFSPTETRIMFSLLISSSSSLPVIRPLFMMITLLQTFISSSESVE